jgi:hypothetical protein
MFLGMAKTRGMGNACIISALNAYIPAMWVLAPVEGVHFRRRARVLDYRYICSVSKLWIWAQSADMSIVSIIVL